MAPRQGVQLRVEFSWLRPPSECTRYLMAVLDACSGSDLAHARLICYPHYVVTWAVHISKP